MMAILLLLISSSWASSSPSTSGMVLRIRLADGSMEKVLIPESAAETMSIMDILKPFDVEDGATIQLGSTPIEASSSVSSLAVKNGSLITIQPSLKKPVESRFSQLKVNPHSWDPFPDLAKDHEHALLKSKTKRASHKSMSYGAIAQLQSSLHVVEAQPEGPLKRVYMCRFSAERFQANGIVKTKKGPTTSPTGSVQPRVGLLLGTIQRERVDKTPRKARTSLSSQTSGADYCTVAKVHAVWEPSGQQKTSGKQMYDADLAQSLLTVNPRVSIIASYLGLVPVGWIFSHPDERHQNDDSLPVYGLDVQTGATLQIARMKEAGCVEGKPFVTLSMNANNGATEAFQLSDVSVQMVHEGMLLVHDLTENKREVPTKYNVLINGKETKLLDSVLCLVNTAMLSHEGSFAGPSATSSVKKNGSSLTNDAKKKLLGCLNDDPTLLQMLCDFNTLVVLDQSLSPDETEILCGAVKKWARGQKQGTQLDSKIKLRLRSILET